jgi:hypothetical protein
MIPLDLVKSRDAKGYGVPIDQSGMGHTQPDGVVDVRSFLWRHRFDVSFATGAAAQIWAASPMMATALEDSSLGPAVCL